MSAYYDFVLGVEEERGPFKSGACFERTLDNSLNLLLFSHVLIVGNIESGGTDALSSEHAFYRDFSVNLAGYFFNKE